MQGDTGAEGTANGNCCVRAVRVLRCTLTERHVRPEASRARQRVCTVAYSCLPLTVGARWPIQKRAQSPRDCTSDFRTYRLRAAREGVSTRRVEASCQQLCMAKRSITPRLPVVMPMM